MIAKVVNETPVPPQRVILDMSVDEFALLAAVKYSHLGGDTVLRNALDDGFSSAMSKLSAPNRARVRAATLAGEKGCEGWNSENVTRALEALDA